MLFWHSKSYFDIRTESNNLWMSKYDFPTQFECQNSLSWSQPPKTGFLVTRPKTQISLGIRPVWSESSLCAQWVAKDPSFLHADSEDSDQTGRMPRLIRVFAGSTFFLLVLSCRGSPVTGQISYIPIKLKLDYNTSYYDIFFYFGITAPQDYFTHFELNQSLGGAKTGDPRENHLSTCKQNLTRLTCDWS